MTPVPPGLTAALSDRYRLDRELGQGGMATVYLAHDLKHDRDVAIKVLRPELAAVLGRDRFLAEIHLTAKLDHPHILTLIDSGEVEAGPGGIGPFLYYVVPFIRGESLRQKLDRESQLPIDEALAIIRQVAGALDHAHRQGVIHRDLKPENILLQEGQAILADFGIALAVKEAGGPRLTETGLTLGTPLYMSPEQATAARQLDARSDIYSLGAVLYEMLAGEPPHTGANAQAVIAKLMTTEAIPLRVLRSTVPESVERAVAKALSKTPADRFGSAGEFAAALTAPLPRVAVSKLPVRAVAIAVGAVTLVAGWFWLMPRNRGRGALLAPPTLTQVTFSGKASTPAISPDARQLAYVTEECAPAGGCSQSVALQNLATSERRTLIAGFNGVWKLVWSGDERYLLVSGRRAGTPNADFLVSTFGGTAQLIGCCGGYFLGSADTVIESPPGNLIAEPILVDRWLQVMTTTGKSVDSIRFRLPGASVLWPNPSPDGRKLIVWRYADDGSQYYIARRDGVITDSLPVLPGSHGFRLQWTGSGDGVLMPVPSDSSGNELWTFLRFPVSSDGRVRRTPDTLAARLRLPGFGVHLRTSTTGELAVELAARARTLWTTVRRSTSSLPVLGRKLFTATGEFGALPSGDGRRILVTRRVTLDGQPATQFEAWPEDGGSSQLVGSPVPGLVNWDVSTDGREIFRLIRPGSGAGVYELSAVDVATGRARQIRTVPDSLKSLVLVRDGVLLYKVRGFGALPEQWRRVGDDPAGPPLFDFPDSTNAIEYWVYQPDGRGSGVLAVAAVADSAYRHGGRVEHLIYVARAGATARRIARLSVGQVGSLRIMYIWPDLSVDVSANVEGSQHLLHLAPGGAPRDLGPLPVQDDVGSLSDDGTRGVVVQSESHPDIWLLKWPSR